MKQVKKDSKGKWLKNASKKKQTWSGTHAQLRKLKNALVTHAHGQTHSHNMGKRKSPRNMVIL